MKHISPRQRRILQGIADGYSAAEIGKQLGIGEETVRTHTRRAMRRIEAKNRAHAVALALRHGIIS